ncbi:hypothetical protein D3C81_1362500 [compost metagenome]
MFEAGPRPLDQVSSARPKALKLAAVAVPAPLDEPEAKGAVRKLALYGLSARPYTPRCMPPLAMGGMLVLPRHTAPAARRRSMVKASRWATRSLKAGLPEAAVRPLTR